MAGTFDAKADTPAVATDVAATDRIVFGDVSADRWDTLLFSALLDAALRVAAAGGVVTFDGTAGKLVVRLRGGVAGTDEVQISHDGTKTIVESLDGSINLRVPSSLGDVQADVVGGGFPLLKSSVFAFPLRIDGILAANGSSAGWGVDPGTGALYPTNAAFWATNPAGSKILTVQVDKTNATLANLTELAATVLAGRKYKFIASLPVTASVVGGYKVAMSGTATATAVNFDVIVETNGVAPAVVRKAALDDATSGTLGTTVRIWIEGTITVNVGGTLVPQFAQSAANGTSSVLLGAEMMLWDMG